ncbi:hypothetical protein ACTM44_21535 [Citrobacter freundii]
MLSRSVTAGRGRTAAQIRPALSQPPPPRQRSAAEPFPPSGAVLARSPDVVPERDRRQGGALLRRYAPHSVSHRCRASVLLLSRSRRPVRCWRVVLMSSRSVTAGRGRTAAQIRPYRQISAVVDEVNTHSRS